MQNAFSESGNSPPVFYTYLWLREDGTPYYVGKGKNNRAWSSHKRHRPPKDRSLIRIQHWQDEATSSAYEIYQIDFWGRKDLGTGCLRNLTDGGEGASGRVLTSDHKAKIGAAQKGRTHTPESNDKNRIAHLGNKRLLGYKHTPESKAKMSARQKGRTLSPETKAKISVALTGVKRSPEVVEKTASANRGRKHSPESKAKMSATKRKKRIQNEKDKA